MYEEVSMKKMVVGIAVLLCIGIVFLGFQLKKVVDKASELVISSVDMESIEDGSYQGECDLSLVNVKVEVLVKDHRIEKISIIEHTNGMGKDAEKIIDHMVDENTHDVDVITGATASSNAFMKAVENALTSSTK